MDLIQATKEEIKNPALRGMFLGLCIGTILSLIGCQAYFGAKLDANESELTQVKTSESSLIEENSKLKLQLHSSEQVLSPVWVNEKDFVVDESGILSVGVQDISYKDGSWTATVKVNFGNEPKTFTKAAGVRQRVGTLNEYDYFIDFLEISESLTSVRLAISKVKD